MYEELRQVHLGKNVMCFSDYGSKRIQRVNICI